MIAQCAFNAQTVKGFDWRSPPWRQAKLLRIVRNMRNRLRELRNQRGFTLEQVAAILGIEHSTVQRWEVGKSSFDAETAWRLAQLYQCHPGELFAVIPPTGIDDPAERAAAEVARRLAPAERKQWLSMGVALARAVGKVPKPKE